MNSKKNLKKRKEVLRYEAQQCVDKSKILLTESEGFLDSGQYHSSQVTQRDIRSAVDITAATKSFDLHLKEFGPYKFRYLANGRHMVLGGRKGHLAAFDWVTKKLHCEINVMESIHDVCFLHNEHMFAAAQKKWTYIYDSNGVELHCLKRMNKVAKMEFLPYHYLLCTGSEMGYLSWLDVTLGDTTIDIDTKMGSLKIMTQNPWNAVICCGHAKGTISMWTPNTKERVASMLCHQHSLTDIAFHPAGRHFATASIDRVVKIWDGRQLGKVYSSYRLNSVPNYLAISQKGLLAVGMENIVEVYKNISIQDECEVYIRHESNSSISGLQFCPYEDVLGVSTQKGFCSLLIPGSGEPNFDALEANPYRSVAAKRESEVKGVLGKLPINFITLNPNTAIQVNTMKKFKPDVRVKVHNEDIKPRFRLRGKSGGAQRFERKRKMRDELIRKNMELKRAESKRLAIKKHKERARVLKENSNENKKEKGEGSVLDRFKPKKTL